MNPSKFLTENNKQVLEESKDLNLIENVYKLKKDVKHEIKGIKSRLQNRLDSFRNSLIEERVDEYFKK
jgi:hypothetical protein